MKRLPYNRNQPFFGGDTVVLNDDCITRQNNLQEFSVSWDKEISSVMTVPPTQSGSIVQFDAFENSIRLYESSRADPFEHTLFRAKYIHTFTHYKNH